MTETPIRTDIGISGGERRRAAEIFEEVFGAKLGIAITDQQHRINLLSEGMQLGHAATALEGEYLVGVAGFTTPAGAFTSGVTYRKILKHVGFLKGQKAAIVLSLFDRKAKPNELFMDGIAVSTEYRGQGIATQLFERVVSYAQEHDYKSIRIDVIDTNPEAKRLYERLGFVADRTSTFEGLRPWLGFGASTTMVYDLSELRSDD